MEHLLYLMSYKQPIYKLILTTHFVIHLMISLITRLQLWFYSQENHSFGSQIHFLIYHLIACKLYVGSYLINLFARQK